MPCYLEEKKNVLSSEKRAHGRLYCTIETATTHNGRYFSLYKTNTI